MKKKLIAVILSLFVVGGIGAAFIVNNSSNNEVAQVQQKSVGKKDGQVQDKTTKNKEKEASKESKDNKVIENTTKDNEAQINQNENSVKSTEVVSTNNDVENNNVTVETVSKPITNSSENITANENVNTSASDTNAQNSATVEQLQQSVNNSNFMDQVESMIFTKVNEERAKNGLAPLSYNNTMEHYARFKSQDMGDRGYFDHNNPEGELITAQMARDGVSYNAWGENIAYIGGVSDPTALANQFMTNWMNSSGHRANILSNNFSSIGIGVYKIGNKVYATQEFYR